MALCTSDVKKKQAVKHQKHEHTNTKFWIDVVLSRKLPWCL